MGLCYLNFAVVVVAACDTKQLQKNRFAKGLCYQ
tara:strand:+ start:13041 stop:13142 length:102 start_codon:yes stop_codon:yes gene_type:complete